MEMMKMKMNLARTALPAMALALAACTGRGSRNAAAATAAVHDASGRLLGHLTATESPAGLVLTGELTGLPPGTHGIHLHAIGRCDAPGFASAGAHWNPAAREHGTLNPAGPHRGDLVNLQAADDGSATVSAVSAGGMLHGTDALLDSDGAAVVVHADPDDYQTDPSGNSGGRIACGVLH